MISAEGSHPETSSFVEEDFLLLGGGFEVLGQPESGANKAQFATASFPDSNISWRAGSKDHAYGSPQAVRAFAIGIRPTIKKLDGTVFGNVVTMYHSFQLSPGGGSSGSMIRPILSMALCGGRRSI